MRLRHFITNVMLTDKMGMQTILAITVSVKKIKGAAHQCYGDNGGAIQCEQTFTWKLFFNFSTCSN